MAVWVTILRFMGDLPEPTFTSGVGDAKVWKCYISQSWHLICRAHVYLVMNYWFTMKSMYVSSMNLRVFSAHLTMLYRDIAKDSFVCLSICHTREPHLNSLRCQNIFTSCDRAMSQVSLCQFLCLLSLQYLSFFLLLRHSHVWQENTKSRHKSVILRMCLSVHHIFTYSANRNVIHRVDNAVH